MAFNCIQYDVRRSTKVRPINAMHDLKRVLCEKIQLGLVDNTLDWPLYDEAFTILFM